METRKSFERIARDRSVFFEPPEISANIRTRRSNKKTKALRLYIILKTKDATLKEIAKQSLYKEVNARTITT